MCDEYAKNTSYGEPIVFGILGVFASLGALAERPGKQLASASIEYRAALYMTADYRIEVKERGPGAVRVLLKDGGRTMMASDFTFRDWVGPDSEAEVPGTAPQYDQSTWAPDQLREGIRVAGRYAPSPGPLRALVERWDMGRKGVTIAQVGVFLWSSYLTGMHLPGLLGTSAKLEVSYVPERTPAEIPFDYETRVEEFDDRFNILRTITELSGRQGTFATAEVSAHVRVVAP